MILRSSITTTKKFFQKTLKNFKSLFSSDYQRLPKTTLPHPHQNQLSYSTNVMDMNNNNNTSYHDLKKLYTDFSDQYESENEKESRRRIKKKAAIVSSPTKQEHEVYNGRSYVKLSNTSSIQECDKQNNKKWLTLQKGKEHNERKYCMVEEKLRELEMLDASNVDYVLEIEEVLHYYSRLTCPAYIEIVDRFFMEMYSGLFGPAWLSTACNVNSRLNLRHDE